MKTEKDTGLSDDNHVEDDWLSNEELDESAGVCPVCGEGPSAHREGECVYERKPLVERLREYGTVVGRPPTAQDRVCHEAACEIEELRTALLVAAECFQLNGRPVAAQYCQEAAGVTHD